VHVSIGEFQRNRTVNMGSKR